MRALESVCLWYISRRHRARPVESDEARIAREYDEMITGRLALGLMQDTHYFSSRAVDEAKKGPKYVLRNAGGERIPAFRGAVQVEKSLEVACEPA